eukprot:g2043.t1
MFSALRCIRSLRLQATHHRSLSSSIVFTESFAGVCESVHTEQVQNKAFVLDGRTCSSIWLEKLLPKVKHVSAKLDRPPKLAVILVGNRPDSSLYVERKREVCNKSGIDVRVHHLPSSITQLQLQSTIHGANEDAGIDGILVQLPLPVHLDEESTTLSLNPWKDVDGLHPLNVGHMLMRGHSPRFVPCTALGCMELLKLNKITVKGKTVVVVGDSNIVGVPLSVLLRNEDAAIVTVCHGISYKEIFSDQKQKIPEQRAQADTCHPAVPGLIDRWSMESRENLESPCPISRNPHLPSITKTADILIVSVGWPELVKKDWVKPGAVVLDVGINVIPRTSSKNSAEQLCIAGDVQFDEVLQVASAISPVPGGVGPMTLAGVVHNTIQAAEYTVLSRQKRSCS